MQARLDSPFYGCAFRNETYPEGEYSVDFYPTKEERDKAVQYWQGNGEVVLLEFNVDERYILKTYY